MMKLGLIVGRVLLASLFFLGGINKILNYATTTTQMSEAGLPMAGLLLPLVILLELGGALIIMLGHKFTPIVALALAGFTLLTNAVFHRFWELEGLTRQLELSLFFKNISIAGALLFLAAAYFERGKIKE